MALTKIDGSVLANTGVTSGNYGGSSTIPTLNIDAQGRIVSATNTTISVANTLITGLITSGQIATVANTQITGTLTSTQLSNTAVTAGTYGGSTQIPVVTIDQQGRITSASNTTVSTTINLSGTTGSGSVSGGGTLTFASNNGFVVSSTGASTLYLNSSQDLQTSASPSFNNLSVTGNLTVSGAYTYTNTAIFQTVDSLIELAANNTGDVVDIGFYGQYNTSSYAGLVRTGGSNFVLFKGLTAPNSNTFGVISLANTATLKANITGGMITALANTIGISDGGTNNSTYTTGALVQYNGSGIVSLANTGTAGTYGNSSYHPVITTDAYGRVSAVTNTAIAIAASAVTSGTLAIAQGGTNASTYTTGNVLYYTGTAVASLANVSTTVTGGLSSSNTITSITTDSYGRLTAYTGAAISLSASSLSGGTISSTILGNSTHYIGTTAIALNRASASQTLTGVSIDGSAGSASTATTATNASGLTGTPNITVGTISSGAITAGGAITSTGNITAYYSDDRLKTKLGAIIGALAKVKSLNGFYYEANETAQALGYEAIREVGVSAQEVQAILPEIVAPAPISDKYLTVRYEKLIPLLVEAIKELSEEVERLKESK